LILLIYSSILIVEKLHYFHIKMEKIKKSYNLVLKEL